MAVTFLTPKKHNFKVPFLRRLYRPYSSSGSKFKEMKNPNEIG